MTALSDAQQAAAASLLVLAFVVGFLIGVLATLLTRR